jgi:metal-dependent amidase/aminoacylase/carboxypeptidase family protein
MGQVDPAKALSQAHQQALVDDEDEDDGASEDIHSFKQKYTCLWYCLGSRAHTVGFQRPAAFGCKTNPVAARL